MGDRFRSLLDHLQAHIISVVVTTDIIWASILIIVNGIP